MRAQMLEVSIRIMNGAPSRKGCVVNGGMTKTSNKCVHPSPNSIFKWFCPRAVDAD